VGAGVADGEGETAGVEEVDGLGEADVAGVGDGEAAGCLADMETNNTTATISSVVVAPMADHNQMLPRNLGLMTMGAVSWFIFPFKHKLFKGSKCVRVAARVMLV
jgi:hypothetical protein